MTRQRGGVEVGLGVGEELALLPADVALQQVGEGGQRRPLLARAPRCGRAPPAAFSSACSAASRHPVRPGEVLAQQRLLGRGVRREDLPLEAAGQRDQPGQVARRAGRLGVALQRLLQLEGDQERLVVLRRRAA